MALLTKNNLIYFGAALIVGACLAFGISSMTYEPVPLQVPENPYQPIAPPAPAVTVLPPQFVPGSMAAETNTTGDPYAPAPAPVIVTTAPLPSITPVVAAGPADRCALKSPWNESVKNINKQTEGAFAMASVIPIVSIIGILMIVVGSFSGPGHSSSSRTEVTFDTATRNITSAMSPMVGFGSFISFIIAVGGVLIAMYIISVVMGSLQYAVTGGC